jgi:hypothetical protein
VPLTFDWSDGAPDYWLMMIAFFNAFLSENPFQRGIAGYPQVDVVKRLIF